ncbi:hypothetical protein DIZ76_015628 [Coccidioides immitis]|nr:hypothetical protein DIZ76_015628 [Coccidioides immitis]
MSVVTKESYRGFKNGYWDPEHQLRPGRRTLAWGGFLGVKENTIIASLRIKVTEGHMAGY